MVLKLKVYGNIAHLLQKRHNLKVSLNPLTFVIKHILSIHFRKQDLFEAEII